MSRTGLVLAAHGSNAEASACALVRDYATRLAARGLFDVVSAAFHLGKPTFAEVLDDLGADDVTVVPLMTSAGYFSEEVLPRELAKNKSYRRLRVRRTQPVGTHPRMISLVASRVRARLREHVLDPHLTTLALVGHGIEHHEGSRTATLELAKSLRRLDVCREVLTAFLDDDPYVESILDRAEQPGVVVLPFLVGGGLHATRDVPIRLGLHPSHGVPPLSGWVGKRFVVCDAAVGTDPGVIEIIEKLALSSADVRSRPWPGDSRGSRRDEREKHSPIARVLGADKGTHTARKGVSPERIP